jgi:hypothetical protein
MTAQSSDDSRRLSGVSAAEVATAIGGHRGELRFTTERQLQDGLAALFRAERFVVLREHALGPLDRPDFLIGGVAVEVKVKGTADQLARQVGRYLAHDEVDAVVVVTSRARHRAIPAAIGGKPVHVVWLGSAF